GSGKTTLLAHIAAAAGVPTAWYSVDSSDANSRVVLGGLERAVTTAAASVSGGWTNVEAAAQALEAGLGSPALVVIDDFHAVNRTPAERTGERFIDCAPAGLAFVIGSRRRAAVKGPPPLLPGQPHAVGPHGLRLRVCAGVR